MTDTEGATDVESCKNIKCGGILDPNFGVIESPNFPNEYPSNSNCEWLIKPANDRRLLLLIPQLEIASDHCKDSLIMRKSRKKAMKNFKCTRKFESEIYRFAVFSDNISSMCK